MFRSFAQARQWQTCLKAEIANALSDSLIVRIFFSLSECMI